MRIRRTVYLQDGQPITLAFVSGIDGHPEAVDDTPAPAPAPKPKAERAPQLTESFIRRVLGRPPRPTAQQAKNENDYRRIMRRIEWRGF